MLDTIKKAEDDDSTILRLYECHGGRGTARVKIDVPFKKATFCNILEDDDDVRPAKTRSGVIEIPYTPFQVVTLKLK